MAARSSSVDPNRTPLFVRLTGAGASGIATIVLDGWAAARFQPAFKARKLLREAKPNEVLFGKLIDDRGCCVDEVVVAQIDFKATQTGNEQIEISCHGGIGVLEAVESLLLSLGIDKGTRHDLLTRAYLNGKMSLVALEANLALARAMTARQAEFLLGATAFQQRWERVALDATLAMRNSEPDLWQHAEDAVNGALARAPAAIALLAEHRIAIVGPVNAGKSTLGNCLIRAERHIVSDIPGTTRDRVESEIDLRGLHIVLADTAGLRATSDEVEQEGQRRAELAAAESELRILLVDASQTPSQFDLDFIKAMRKHGPVLLVLNKCDLGVNEDAQGLGFLAESEPILISARDRTGIQELESAIEDALLGKTSPQAGDPFTRRQVETLESLKDALEKRFDARLLVNAFRVVIGKRYDEAEMRRVFDASEI